MTADREAPEYQSDSSDDRSDEPSEECEDDRCDVPQLPIWHCVDCDSSYCSDCWSRQGPHKPKKKGRDGVPHERTNPAIVRRLKTILHPTRSPELIQRLHEEDEATKWFGVARDLTGRPNFEDYGRYASLMSSISPIESLGNRYPQLVSFIGVTNAGKSTLIKMLVDHDEESRSAEDRPVFPSPIVGSIINDTMPTSGDVHLYADPATHAEQLPILYADCEGFEGGERVPLGARSRRRANSDPEKRDQSKLSHVHSRPIAWAETEETRQREYAVTALYPRLLYTFSDCVVFVLRNAKTFQSAVLTKLLDWGVAALEKSLNQPALPHCIVALNGTDPGVDEREWNINYATQSLLSSVKGSLDYVEGVPRFRELAEHWRALGKHIYTVEDLILRYYSSFKVIRIPSKPRYMQINDQIGKLHDVIKSNCEESFRTKRRARMLTNADELNVYLQSGFDHFTKHLNVPFNFMQVSLRYNAIPNDFGGHILQLCTTISSQQPKQPGRAAWLFEKLSVMLASCVLLDCARFRKGRVEELFTSYEKFFDYALGEFTEMHWPCSYISSDGSRRCMLVKARHEPKGHQDEKGIIAAGDYQAGFDMSYLPQWKLQLRSSIGSCSRDFQYELEQMSREDDVQAIPEEKIALDLHLEYMNHFYETVGPASAICSHATCFCCLMDVPEHPLPCGHVLCSACIKAYGKPGKSAVSMVYCPLHKETTRWAKPASIKFKPAGAGVRVLCLDGGGIRGVVQLEVLKAIEQALDDYLPVQSFFDLIVGTGTGGMIAVALSMQDRSVDAVSDMFTAVCDHAFTPKLTIPIIGPIAAALGSGPRYKTKPLHHALKTAFGEEQDLFGSATKTTMTTRVALTSTTATVRDSIVLANYRRSEDTAPMYQFERPHEPEMELKIWQTVAASTAAPNYFKPFVFHSRSYLDGGLRNPNPAFIADRERRLIWPDIGDPDLFLSLGTGQNRISVLSKLSERPRGLSGSPILQQPGPSSTIERKGIAKLFQSRRVDDVLDAELAWTDFRTFAVREKNENKGRRYIRFNPDLDKEPPAPDRKDDLRSLQHSVKKRLQTPHRQAALRNVAHRLLASTFYFDLQTKQTAEKTEQVCSGVVSCRFEDGSMEMCALGKILEERQTEDFEPYLFIRPDASKDEGYQIVITMDVIRGMTDNSVFGLPNIMIPLKDESKATSINLFLTAHDGLEPDGFPISGFPRVLLVEPSSSHQRRPTRGEPDPATSPTLRMKSISVPSEEDSISLNGPANKSSSESSSNEVQPLSPFGAKVTSPAISLADILAQQQGAGTSVRGRTNRFWTYIGNNHIAAHPEMYSPEEVAKFARGNQVENAAEMASPQDPPVSPQEYHELDGQEKRQDEKQQDEKDQASQPGSGHRSVKSKDSINPELQAELDKLEAEKRYWGPDGPPQAARSQESLHPSSRDGQQSPPGRRSQLAMRSQESLHRPRVGSPLGMGSQESIRQRAMSQGSVHSRSMSQESLPYKSRGGSPMPSVPETFPERRNGALSSLPSQQSVQRSTAPPYTPRAESFYQAAPEYRRHKPSHSQDAITLHGDSSQSNVSSSQDGQSVNRDPRASNAREEPQSAVTEFEDDQDQASVYSGEEISVAVSSPLVQLPPPYPARERGFEKSPLESAIATALPDTRTRLRLDDWLKDKRNGPLRVVNEQVCSLACIDGIAGHFLDLRSQS